MTYTRRGFLKAMGLGAGTLAVSGNAEARRASKYRLPNILVIMSDEHNASVLGCTGNTVINTLNLDGLARNGFVFDSAYCNSPLCVPSRLSFTAGKYASRVGVWNNDCWLPRPDYPSLPRLLNANGYESYLCGKMHYDETRTYGFTEIGGRMNRSFKTGKGSRRDAEDLKRQAGISDRFDEFHAGEHSNVLDHDRDVTAGTLEFLRHRKGSDAPFFLLSGYLAPHFPLIVPQKYWDVYRDRVPMPVIPEGYLDSMPRNYKHLRVGFNYEDVPNDTVKKGRELYYGLVQWVDEEIGRVLAGLDEAGLADNTVVIYTADHGENMGEHGLWWKNCLYDSASRVPLIVRWPARWHGGEHRSGACSLVDVVQTIAELGGARTPLRWDGDSMVAWMDNANAPWKCLAVSEYYAHNVASGAAMIRMGRFKYIYHTRPDSDHPAERELYDLESDPGELINLAARPEHRERITSMYARLVREIGEDPERTEQRCRADLARGYNRSDIRKGKRGRSEPK